MKTLIFTEGGSKNGYGHIARCSSLYLELEKRGIDVEFIIHGDEQIKEVLGNKNYRLENWLEMDYLLNKDIQNTCCIVDSYKAESKLYYYISNHSLKLLSIDDYNRINYPKGIVVNPSIYTDELDYAINNNVTYLLGKDYIILREAFNQNHSKEVNSEIKEILIILGGSDIRNLTPKILDILKSDCPHIRKNVVLGKGYANVEDINKLADTNTRLYFNLNDEAMRNLMINSDIAITAAGQSIYELIRAGIPFIPIEVIDNQRYTTKGLIKYNLVDRILYWDMNEFPKGLLSELHKIREIEKRKLMIERYKNLIDGLGTKRIISALLEGVEI